MAIALRAVGARTRVDTGASGLTQTAAMPTGHVSGDWLLLTVITDDNNTPTTPSGWTLIKSGDSGTSVRSPYVAMAKLWLYSRFDTGALGSSVSVTFGSGNWPAGHPFIIMWVTGYSGTDTSSPVEQVLMTTVGQNSAGTQAHPQATTAVTGDWLITIRAAGFYNPPATWTCSVGTDTERVDVEDGVGEGLGGSYYDTNATVAAGAQTIRSTISSRSLNEWGSCMATVTIRPPATATAALALPGTASAVGTAFNASVTTTNGGWDLCAALGLPVYSFAIDWAGDGSYVTAGDDATTSVISDVAITYGRDQDRQLNPASVGNAAFSLINVDRKYSPEWVTSVLYGNLEPARPMRGEVTWSGNTYPLFQGRIDDYDIKVDKSDRSVSFTFLDGLNDLSEVTLSTGVYSSMRTGELIDLILDEVGWTGGRDIDLGATIVKYWWAEGTDAFTAVNDLVASEGPPAIAFVAPDGTFTFHDRHHRLQTNASITSQGTFSQGVMFDCAVPDTSPNLDFTAPFTYSHGWRDIVNSVQFDVEERQVDSVYSAVYSTSDIISLGIGQSFELTFSGNDPFIDAITPVLNTDYSTSGPGVLNVTLSRTSGASAKLTLLAVGGAVVVQTLQVRAHAIPIVRAVKISRIDAESITTHGERSYPGHAPWANANDADAIASMVLIRYAQRRPTIQLRIVTQDPVHFVQVLERTVGDRITVINDEMGLNSDFFIERVTHQIQRFNQSGKPPVHSVVFGCEKDQVLSANPFRFDVRGAGFDQGTFDPIQTDDPDSVFIFDDPVQGQFDLGLFGT